MEEENFRDNLSREIEYDASQSIRDGISSEPAQEKEDSLPRDEPPPKFEDETADEDLQKKEVTPSKKYEDKSFRNETPPKIEENTTDDDFQPMVIETSPNPLYAALARIEQRDDDSGSTSSQSRDRLIDRPQTLSIRPMSDLMQNPEPESEHVYCDTPSWDEILRSVMRKLSEKMVENELRMTKRRFSDSLSSSEIFQCLYRLCMQYETFPPILRLKKKNYTKVEESYTNYAKKVKNKIKNNFLLHMISSTMLANAEVGSREYCLACKIRGQVLLDDKKYMYALVDFNRALKCDILSQKIRDDIEKNRQTCISKIRLSKNEELWITLRNIIKGVEEWQKKKSIRDIASISRPIRSEKTKSVESGSREKSEKIDLTDEEIEPGIKTGLLSRLEVRLKEETAYRESLYAFSSSRETQTGCGFSEPDVVSKSEIVTHGNEPAVKQKHSHLLTTDNAVSVSTPSASAVHDVPSKPLSTPDFFTADEPELMKNITASASVPIEIIESVPFSEEVVIESTHPWKHSSRSLETQTGNVVSKSEIETYENEPAVKQKPSHSLTTDDAAFKSTIDEPSVSTPSVFAVQEVPLKPSSTPVLFTADELELIENFNAGASLPIEIESVPFSEEIVIESTHPWEHSPRSFATIKDEFTSFHAESDTLTPGSQSASPQTELKLPFVQLKQESEPLKEINDNVELMIQIVDNKMGVNNKTTLTVKTDATTKISDIIRDLKENIISKYEPLCTRNDGLNELNLDEHMSDIASELALPTAAKIDDDTEKLTNVLSQVVQFVGEKRRADLACSDKAEGSTSATRTDSDTSSDVKLRMAFKILKPSSNDDGTKVENEEVNLTDSQNVSARKLKAVCSDNIIKGKNRLHIEDSSHVVPLDELVIYNKYEGVSTGDVSSVETEITEKTEAKCTSQDAASQEQEAVSTKHVSPVKTETSKEYKADTLQDVASKEQETDKSKEKTSPRSVNPQRTESSKMTDPTRSTDLHENLAEITKNLNKRRDEAKDEPSKEVESKVYASTAVTKTKSKQQSRAKRDKQSKNKRQTSPKPAPSSTAGHESLSSLRESIEGWEYLSHLNFDWKFPPPEGNLTNDLLPNTSSKIKLVENEKWGLHYIATEELNPGELLMVDNPYVKLRYPQYIYTHCAYCLLRCEAMIPCTGCSIDMYCSEACRDRAWNSYHQVECQIIEYLAGGEDEKLLALAIRTLLIASDQGKSLLQLRKHPVYRNIFKKNLDLNTRIRTNEYMCMHNLSDKSPNELEKNFNLYFQAAYAVYLLKNTTFFDESKQETEENVKLTDLEKYVGNFIIKMLLTARVNCHMVYFDQSILFFSSGGQTAFDECEIGCAIFPLVSYLNHSCDSNVITYDVKDKMAVYATHFIKPDQQIFCNYGSQYFDSATKFRRVHIRKRYLFYCECDACQNNWELPASTNPDTPLEELIKNTVNQKHFSQLRSYMKRIRKNFKAGKDIRDELDWLTIYLKFICQYFKLPNYEYHSVQLMIKMIIWAKTGGKYPDALAMKQVYPETPAKERSLDCAEFSSRFRNVQAIYSSAPYVKRRYFGKRSTPVFQE